VTPGPQDLAAAGPAGSTGAAVERALLFAQNCFTLKVPALEVQIGLFTQVQGLSAQVDVMEYLEGGRNDFVHKLPTRIKHPNLTLKRGVTNESALLRWLEQTVVQAQLTDIALTLHQADGEKLRSWGFAAAYPVKWTGPDLNAGGTEIMSESLEIAHQGIKIVEPG
jgi:phage tail-like protein